MASPISSLDRYAPTLLFVFLELVCFILIINFNQKQGEIFVHSSSLLSGSLLNRVSKIRDYTGLLQNNQELLEENAHLLTEIINSPPRDKVVLADTRQIPFDIIPARVITNSIISTRNMITLDQGALSEIQKPYGVISNDGVVGVVSSVTQHFASVISLLNLDTRISASIKGLGFFGTISWSGKAYDELLLSDIPTHASVQIGNEVVTSGYSTIFPPNILIGKVTGFKVSKDGAFYDISCEPSVDFTQLKYVYVLKSNFTTERDSLAL